MLEANQEVEDALVAFLNSQREVSFQQANVDDLNESLKLLLINFEEGSIDFSPIFVFTYAGSTTVCVCGCVCVCTCVCVASVVC